MTKQVITFGCRLNAFESQTIQSHIDAIDDKEVIVFNTCAVTKEAERQARQAIRKARRKHPDARIVVTGCAAQINPESYAHMPEVNQVLGNEEKLEKRFYEQSDKTIVNDIMDVKETALHMLGSFDGKSRAFLQVQNGCNHRCTFCIIPYGRGNSRSVPVGQIVTYVRQLVEQGFKEVVFTGVDVSDYGKDLPGQPSLGQMIRRVLALVPELPRLRLSSIDVAEIDEDILQLIEHEPRLMPHLHISLQAGDDMILKRMKRRHTRQDVIDFCHKVRALRPDMAFGADIIAGFPTETDAMFQNTLALVKEADLQYLHVFPYSAREGTPAAKMPQLSEEIKKTRAQQLREAGEVNLKLFLEKHLHSTQQAIVEKPHFARSENFVGIELMQACEVGSIITAHITASEGQQWKGEVV